MEIRTILVDDEEDARELLKIFLKDDKEIVIVDECKNGKEAVSSIEKLKPSIVFLDIQMPELNGLDVIKKLSPPYPYFIFVTAFDDYAIKAFELNAIDYILKPYSEDRIKQSLSKAKHLVINNELTAFSQRYKKILRSLENSGAAEKEESYLQRISVKTQERTLFIDVVQVALIEAADQYVELYTTEGKFIVRDSLDHLEKMLDPKLFFRTHRSSIINTNEVKALESPNSKTSMIVLKNDMKVRLSNTRKQLFKQVMQL